MVAEESAGLGEPRWKLDLVYPMAKGHFFQKYSCLWTALFNLDNRWKTTAMLTKFSQLEISTNIEEGLIGPSS